MLTQLKREGDIAEQLTPPKYIYIDPPLNIICSYIWFLPDGNYISCVDHLSLYLFALVIFFLSRFLAIYICALVVSHSSTLLYYLLQSVKVQRTPT